MDLWNLYTNTIKGLMGIFAVCMMKEFSEWQLSNQLEGRTREAVRVQAKKLGLNIYNCKPWTEEENEILRKYYPVEGTNVADRLSGRTRGAITAQAIKKLKLKYKDNKNNKYKYVYKMKNRYFVSISINGKVKHFGMFDSEEEAAKVAMEKVKEYGKAI